MHGYIEDLETLTQQNKDFRRVLYTGAHSQLVLMSIAPGDDIGEEVHALDQFLRIESGDGQVVIDGVSHAVSDGWCAVIPAGARHNVLNTSSAEALRLYTIYSPPEHLDGRVHATKADALADTEDEFDGKTTE